MIEPVVPAKDAATLVLVRVGSDADLQVLLLQRTMRASFVAGAYVFPGGAVDQSDAELAVGYPGIPHAAFAVAAVRESFEEAGILLAHRGNGGPISADQRMLWRSELSRADRTFNALVRDEELVLELGQLRYLSRWVTPVGSPKRFDARFFLVSAPVDQEPIPDQTEIVGSKWVNPKTALAEHAAGEILLILPTAMTLRSLGDSPELAAAGRGSG